MSQNLSIIDIFLWVVLGLGGWAVYQSINSKLAYATVTYTPTAGAPAQATAASMPGAHLQVNLPSDWYYTPSVHTNRRPATQSTFPPPPSYPWTEEDFQKWTEQIKIIARNNATYKSGR